MIMLHGGDKKETEEYTGHSFSITFYNCEPFSDAQIRVYFGAWDNLLGGRYYPSK